MAEQLCTLNAVKSWLNIGLSDSDNDVVLTMLINQATRFILNFVSISTLLYSQRTDTASGRGGAVMLLQDTPVHSIVSVTANGINIPAATSTSWVGYVLEPQTGTPPAQMQQLSLNGYVFNKGVSNVVVQYMAGYAALGEVRTAASSVGANQAYGNFARDEGVTLDGVAMVKVGSTPTAGQYTVDAAGNYGFATADAGKTVALS